MTEDPTNRPERPQSRIDFDAMDEQLAQDRAEQAVRDAERTPKMGFMNIKGLFNEIGNFLNAAITLLKGDMKGFDLFTGAWLGKWMGDKSEPRAPDPTDQIETAGSDDPNGAPPQISRPDFLKYRPAPEPDEKVATNEDPTKLDLASEKLREHHANAVAQDDPNQNDGLKLANNADTDEPTTKNDSNIGSGPQAA